MKALSDPQLEALAIILETLDDLPGAGSCIEAALTAAGFAAEDMVSELREVSFG